MQLRTDLYYGQSKLFFCDSDETGLTYDYVGYNSKDGVTMVARYPKDGSSGRYYAAVGGYTTIWAARATFTYVVPEQIPELLS
jgi:hypothetical protein